VRESDRGQALDRRRTGAKVVGTIKSVGVIEGDFTVRGAIGATEAARRAHDGALLCAAEIVATPREDVRAFWSGRRS
jgi:hypothetical protein